MEKLLKINIQCINEHMLTLLPTTTVLITIYNMRQMGHTAQLSYLVNTHCVFILTPYQLAM